MDEAASPDEYFCEECRKDLHKVTTSPKGYVLAFIRALFASLYPIMSFFHIAPPHPIH
jgi:hypothetical protein